MRENAIWTGPGAPWKLRNPTRYKLAFGMLMADVPRDRVVTAVLCPEVSERDAEALVDEAWQDGWEERQREGREDLRAGAREIAIGLALAVVAILLRAGEAWWLTLSTMVGGIAMLAWGIKRIRS